MNYRHLVKENTDLFFQRLAEIAGRLNFPAAWLEHIIYIESNFNHKARNSIGATGLIQFTNSTAKDLGTTTAQLLGMSNLAQLNYVEKYFNKMIKAYGVPRSLLDAYLLVFYPAMVSKPDTYSLPSAAYAANRGVDSNKDGKITRADIKAYLERRLDISVGGSSSPIIPIVAVLLVSIVLLKTTNNE